MDIGETFTQSAIHEVNEEAGADIRIDRIIGIYPDPGHVFACDDTEVRQEFSICLARRQQGTDQPPRTWGRAAARRPSRQTAAVSGTPGRYAR